MAPASRAAARSDPSRMRACSMTGAANASASSRVRGSSRSARICGRFVRRSDPVCRSIPTSHLATTSVIIRCAMRDASDPRADPGNERFRSRRSGR